MKFVKQSYTFLGFVEDRSRIVFRLFEAAFVQLISSDKYMFQGSENMRGVPMYAKYKGNIIIIIFQNVSDFS